MNNLYLQIEELEKKISQITDVLNLKKKKETLTELREEMSSPNFWQNNIKAISVSKEAEEIAGELEPWEELEHEISELKQLLEISNKEKEGDSIIFDLENKLEKIKKKFSELEFLALFSETHDKNNVLLSIHSGVGGVDAQDWAQMLERMYLRFSERKGFEVETLDKNYANEAGIKNVVLRIKGLYAYGYLKSENGVHRLLRNSPFNADNLRQTSFALVEVIPELKEEKEIELKDEDIRIDFFRSSGPGGQSVNTTDSAVRIVHLESGITVSCQSERSQHQNKENALKILKAKLQVRKIEQREDKESELKGDVKQADWGKQIRSYFLYGTKLVKDHRTNLENTNTDAVLDGDIDSFIEAYLKYIKK